MGLDDYRVSILFRLIMMILLLMSLDMVLMPMEPRVLAPLRAPPLRGHFVICNL
jgi:hypothetical protein